MTRRLLVLAGVVAVLLAAIVLVRAVRADTPTSPGGAASDEARVRDAVRGEIGWRYRHAQPNHWRACVLQP
jgi:hypothetical protein